jgi:cytochrome c-type biogenesis protein CcmE
MELAQVPDRMFAKIFLAVVVVVAASRFAVRTAHDASNYHLVDDLVASGLRAHEGEVVRVHGYVVTGSLERLDGDDALHRFLLVWGGVALRAEVRGPLPDTFRDQAEVIVTGTLVQRDGWRIEGTAVIAKCSDRYEAGPARPADVPDFK